MKTISVPMLFTKSKYAAWQESVQKNIEWGFGVHRKKFKVIQTPLQLHCVNNIFYVVKLCICLHNAMVIHCIESEEDLETEDMYNTTICNGKDIETCQIVEDDAHDDIQSEDKFFAENQDKLNQNSDAVHLALLEKYKCAEYLGHKLRVINMQWKKLSNKDEHFKLQAAIKLEIKDD